MNKYDYDYVFNEFLSRGYLLLSKSYKNVYEKLLYICPNGHKHSIAYRHFHKGHGCLKCVGIDNSKRFRMDFSIIEDSFISNGYELLTTEYINAHQQLEYRYPYGHRHSMTWNNWSKGYRCPTCDEINRSEEGHWNWRGGISFEPYCRIFKDKSFKNSIKARDNYECQNPDCWHKDKVLHIHHIDYNKKNCDENNLITLCRSCNARANINREYYLTLYRDILSKRGIN